MTEREAIVAWLRERAEWHRKQAIQVAKYTGFRNAAQHEERSDVLANLADAIESGDHIKETEDDQ